MSFFRPSPAATGSRNSQGSSRPISRVSSQRIKSPNPTVPPLNFDMMKTPTVHSSGLLASTASSRAKSISPNYSSAPSPSPSTAPGDRKFSFCSVDTNDPDGTVRRFHRLLNKPHTSKMYRTKADIENALKRLRRYILAEGIPTELDPSLRPRIWKILLQVDTVDTATYIRYVRKGPCPVREKIRNDTFRTLATDNNFKSRVREDMLVRLLDAFVWRSTEAMETISPVSPTFPHLPATFGRSRQPQQPSQRLTFNYVQGMNVLAAPFLYTMPTEVEAFYSFARFIERACPLYVQPTLEGVHRGLKLLDRCLGYLDASLYNHLRSKNLSAELYAFPSVLTFCACTPPLDQVLQLWDFLLAFGVHLNVLAVISQMLLMREAIMESQSPMKILRTFPPLDARAVIGVTVGLVRQIPDDLYDELVKHPWEIRSRGKVM